METMKTVTEKIIRRKGGFKKDGSTHHSGIQNEHSIVEFLNKIDSVIGNHIRPTKDHILTHKGGTQSKADAVVINTITSQEEFTLSIKNHKTGTFDWLNSTKGFPEEIQHLLKERTKEIRDSYKNHENIEISRTELDTMFATVLGELKNNDSFIKNILKSIYDKYTDGIIIRQEKENQVIYFDKSQLTELQVFNDYSYSLKHNEGTCSAQIMRKNSSHSSEQEEINTHLRIRLVLNNGVNALVGTSSKNKNSVPCLKIQQDRVDELIDKIEKKIIEKIIFK